MMAPTKHPPRPRPAVVDHQRLGIAGNSLMLLLEETRRTRRQSTQQLAQALGVTAATLSKWKRKSAVAKMSRSRVERVAAYLGLPVLRVLRLAGQLPEEDMTVGPLDYERLLNQRLSLLQSDTDYAANIETPLRELPLDTQRLLGELYIRVRIWEELLLAAKNRIEPPAG
jgi:transcriptional regulator with XRE-family HTH domain